MSGWKRNCRPSALISSATAAAEPRPTPRSGGPFACAVHGGICAQPPARGRQGSAAGGARSGPMPSSVIRAFDYDAVAHRLAVTFVTGKRYAYLGVPAEVAHDFRKAFSKGEYFNA